MQDILERAIGLKKILVDFVYDAEGELASALETYAAQKGTKNSYGIKQQSLSLDLFTTDGKVGKQSPLDLFIEQKDLKKKDLEIIKPWRHNFIGLFEIQVIEDGCYRLMNWLTAKSYKVYAHPYMSAKEIKRWQPGEIILTIIAPINEDDWFFYSDRIIKGRLSQPKLAVAVGEFRENYPDFLYADAPELLEQAWESVAVYHTEFVDYLGTDNLTLPGYKLNQKIGELQQKMSQKMLADAGIDSNKSLSEVLSESAVDEAEFTETAADLGVDGQGIEEMIKNKDKLSMVTPKVDLPNQIKQAASVTVFSHPQWGQMFLPDFAKFTDLLAMEQLEIQENSQLLVEKYLQLPEANYYVWQQLKQKYAVNLTKLLQNYTNQSDFNLDLDLNELLLKYAKTPELELPAIASVPLHLNNLFEAAVAQVQKTKSKAKKKQKKKGFQ